MPVSEERLQILKANNEAYHLETREEIRNALLLLMNEKDYNEIRMTDIIRRSGVSRAGVYKNYKSKEEILFEIYKEPIDDFFSSLGNSVFENIEIIFRLGKKHEKTIRAIIDAGLEHRFLEMLNGRFEGISTSFYIPLWNGLLYNAFIEWARDGMKGSVEETVERMQEGLKLLAEAIETGLTNSTQNRKKESIMP